MGKRDRFLRSPKKIETIPPHIEFIEETIKRDASINVILMRKILVAGVGNRLMGDDGFGPRVIDLLTNYTVPQNVELRDVGTAGITIATDLSDYDEIIFLDSMNLEGEPGRLVMDSVKVENDDDDLSELAKTTLHEVGLEGLLRFSKKIGTLPSKVLLIGCKPKKIEVSLDLSPEVEDATNRAAKMVLNYIKKG
jgi:hydrogenase maturation protease